MKETFTRKIYYKRFSHRLLISVKPAYGKADNKMPTTEVVEWLLHNKFETGQFRSLASTGFLSKERNVTVFFKDPEVFEYLKDMIGERWLIEYEKPFTNDHVAFLEENEKVITRAKLVHGKYRVILRVKASAKDWRVSAKLIADMRAWCIDQFGSEFANRDRYMIYNCTNLNFYFSDPKDAMLFKMAWGTENMTTERVVLLSELAQASKVS